MENHSPAKALYWIGSSLRDVRAFPKAVRRVLGQALDDAQHGEKHPGVKPLKGFGGAGVLEIVEDNDGDMIVAPEARPLTSQFHIIQPQVVK